MFAIIPLLLPIAPQPSQIETQQPHAVVRHEAPFSKPVPMASLEAPEVASTPFPTPLPTPEPTSVPAPSQPVSGSHEDWMSAAGIAPSDYSYVDFIISHESTWGITAQAPNGPYGLCQSWPGNKMAAAGDDWQTNPVTQLRWCTMHASQYGGWGGAYTFWLSHRAW